VALFDPRDADHAGCAAALAAIAEPLCTTVPVLTEAFHLLAPGSIGARRLMDFVSAQGLGVWFLDDAALGRAFELMVQYADRPMDLADASLVVLAESLRQRRVFTLDRGDFAVYRVKKGHQTLTFDVLDPGR
jgi:predicted nucleic acid-binding protein